jgi:hypothetical protein
MAIFNIFKFQFNFINIFYQNLHLSMNVNQYQILNNFGKKIDFITY